MNQDPEQRQKWMKDRVSEINEKKKKRELERYQDRSDEERQAMESIVAERAEWIKERLIDKWQVSDN